MSTVWAVESAGMPIISADTMAEAAQKVVAAVKKA